MLCTYYCARILDECNRRNIVLCMHERFFVIRPCNALESWPLSMYSIARTSFTFLPCFIIFCSGPFLLYSVHISTLFHNILQWAIPTLFCSFPMSFLLVHGLFSLHNLSIIYLYSQGRIYSLKEKRACNSHRAHCIHQNSNVEAVYYI